MHKINLLFASLVIPSCLYGGSPQPANIDPSCRSSFPQGTPSGTVIVDFPDSSSSPVSTDDNTNNFSCFWNCGGTYIGNLFTPKNFSILGIAATIATVAGLTISHFISNDSDHTTTRSFLSETDTALPPVSPTTVQTNLQTTILIGNNTANNNFSSTTQSSPQSTTLIVNCTANNGLSSTLKPLVNQLIDLSISGGDKNFVEGICASDTNLIQTLKQMKKLVSLRLPSHEFSNNDLQSIFTELTQLTNLALFGGFYGGDNDVIIREFLPLLQNMPNLRSLSLYATINENVFTRMRADLPQVNIINLNPI